MLGYLFGKNRAVVLNGEVEVQDGVGRDNEEEEKGKIKGEAIAEKLNRTILQLFGKHIENDGSSVNYAGIASDPLFSEYKAIAFKLREIELAALPEEQWMCLLLNIYNALVIHGTVVLGVPSGMFGRLHFYATVSYQIGDQIYSLDDIEHGLLRHNRKHPAPFYWNPQFYVGDPRMGSLAPARHFDNRIHFALVCGARSCPPVRVYTPACLNFGLRTAAEVFCRSNVEILVAERTVRVSKLFQWYMSDFGEDERAMLRAISKWLLPEDQQQLHDLLDSPRTITMAYHPYDWSLNE